MVVVARAASNSTAVSEATVEDKPASLAESVADKQVIDSDCWRVTVVENVAETFADTLRWRYLEARISDTVIDTVAIGVNSSCQLALGFDVSEIRPATCNFVCM